MSATKQEPVAYVSKTCPECRGMGVRYSCGNRDAEMTCRTCSGNGRVLVLEPVAAAKPNEATS